MRSKTNTYFVSRSICFSRIAVAILALALIVFGAFATINAIRGHKHSEDTPSTTVNTISNETPSSSETNTLVVTPLAATITTDTQSQDVPEETVESLGTTDTEEEFESEEVLPIYEGKFEVSIDDAYGMTAVCANLVDAPNSDTVLSTLPSETPFKILVEEGDWWKVILKDGTTGYVVSSKCMIDLASVIPSIQYNITNSESSLFRSSGKEIPQVTGNQLYNSKHYNAKLGKTEYFVPVMYSTALLIMDAQKAALADGRTLVIYEAFRPADTQSAVSSNLIAVMNGSDKKLSKEIIDGMAGWDYSWFIAVGTSNHQRGYAIDVSLAEVISTEIVNCGSYSYVDVTEYAEYQMPTSMHELSAASASLQYGVSSKSETQWKSVPNAKGMNESALLLRDYLVNAGFTPLASEWWHFNDLATRNALGSNSCNGSADFAEVMANIPD